MALPIEYIAGFFDGEGCIVIHKGTTNQERKTPQYDLSVSEGFHLALQIAKGGTHGAA